MLIGSHLSIAGSMVNALDQGETLGLSCVQVFTKNQQQWKAKPLDAGMVKDWLAKVAALGWNTGGPDGRGGITSHASYLINMASPNDELWEKSVALMIDEVERCEALAIPYLVFHPGSFVGWTLEEGLSRIAAGWKKVFAATPGYKTISCFEGTAGAGSQIGGAFEHLAALWERTAEAAGDDSRLGYCLDTCHLHAAGHDLSTREAAQATLDRFDGVCGLSRVKALHVNDSKGKLGSHLDRHDHIGHGWVGGGAKAHAGEGEFSAAKLGRSGFVEVMNRGEWAKVPRLLETPKGDTKDGKAWDLVNMERLLGLVESPGKVSKGRERSKSAAGSSAVTKRASGTKSRVR
ncbi:MAG: deoxyribonuclease IV [Tepidisphaera sp.]|nr:deoxyribonuclease IV [Tepidisphaera sp.]